jgi:hypothetical protein
MSSSAPTPSIPPERGWQPPDLALAHLVAQVYEDAPPEARGQLLEYLLKSMGVVSLLAIADGIFAKIRFRSGWPELHIQLEDIQNVRPSDVAALVDHACHMSVEAIDGLTRMLAVSPAMAGSAAAAMLVTMLLRRARRAPHADRVRA